MKFYSKYYEHIEILRVMPQGLTSYQLTYGQDVILPLELAVNSLQVTKQHGLQPEEYSQAMF